jgi:phage head maturation protease
MSDDCEYVLHGLSAEFDKPFQYGDGIIVLKSGCLDSSLKSGTKVVITMNHEIDKPFGSSNNRLQLYANKTGMYFRYFMPTGNDLSDVADDLETYMPVSVSIAPTKTEMDTVDGVDVTYMVEAEIKEVSILERTPAIKTTFARVSSLDRCGDLKTDVDSGLFDLSGKLISLHRKMLARENGGVINYKHVSSEYDRASTKFQNALLKLG